MTDATCAKDEIFVFGSNLRGLHGKGAALTARLRYGANNRQHSGMMGPVNRCYAIPTKDHQLRPLPLPLVLPFVTDFIGYATEHPELKFFLTRVGCGLAGRTDAQMAPLFKDAPPNVRKPDGW